MSPGKRIDPALIVAVFAIALRAWLPGVNRSLWLDEQMIALNIRDRGFARLAGALDHEQAAPLGWLIIERLVFVTLGPLEWALRLQPFLSGVATVLLAWWFGRRYLGTIASVALVALFGFNWALLTYTSELKHYSSDVFFALALIALARWVLDDPRCMKRHLAWWGTAVLGSWLSMGAVFATPAIALVLFLTAVWRRPPLTWVRFAAPGVVWLAQFGVHYLLSLRPATRNTYLANFWAGLGYPPDGAGPIGSALWFANRVKYLLHNTLYLDVTLEPALLAKTVFAVFTALVLAGLVVAVIRDRAFGLVLCGPLITAVILAQLRVAPLFGRLALWLAPAIFVAAAYALDARPKRLRWLAPLAFLVMLVPFVNSAKAISRPISFDDRAAVAWMRERHRPGDVALLVATAERAPQWYDPEHAIAPRRTVVSLPAGPDCDPAQLAQVLRDHRRAIVYAGARIKPYEQTHAILEARLSSLGTVTERQAFSTEGMTYIVELDHLSASTPVTGDCIRVY